jgi:hypothetical protein
MLTTRLDTDGMILCLGVADAVSMPMANGDLFALQMETKSQQRRESQGAGSHTDTFCFRAY